MSTPPTQSHTFAPTPPPPADSPLTVAVTGATGFVGRAVVRELLARGHAVRALTRTLAKAREVFGGDAGRIEWVVGDVCNTAALAQLVTAAHPPGGTARVGAFIHLVGIIREVRGESSDRPQTFERMHVSATRHAVDACRKAGIKRFVQMSALGVTPDAKAEYQRTKWEAERYIRRGFGDDTDLDWTIFRPSLIHGADGEFVQMIADMCSGDIAPFFFLPYFARKTVDTRVPGGAIDWVSPRVQPVAVEDVAFAFAEALQRPDSIGEIYNLVGPDVLTWPEMLEFFRDTLPGANRKLNPFFIPGEHAAIIATVAKTLGVGGLLPFDRGQALMGAEDATGDPSKARAHLGLSPRPFRPTVRAYAARV